MKIKILSWNIQGSKQHQEEHTEIFGSQVESRHPLSIGEKLKMVRKIGMTSWGTAMLTGLSSKHAAADGVIIIPSDK